MVDLRRLRKQQALFEARPASDSHLSPGPFLEIFSKHFGAEPDFSSTPPKKDCVLTTLLLAADLSPGIVSLLPFILIIGVFYLLLIRPNQKRQQQWQKMLGSLKTGDKITTNGGIRGTILNIKDDVIQLRVPPDNIKLEVVKSAIASVTTPDETPK